MSNLVDSVLREAAAYVDRWLALRREIRDLPGLAVAIRYRDQLILSQAYGFAQLDPPVPMTTGHIFRIASHSKTFTATAVMQLAERGQLRLDDRASRFVPWLTSDVTVRQLLGHAGGVIRDGIDANFWQVERPFPDLDSLRALASDAIVFQPNERFKYSNIGYALLGQIVAAASGSPYNDYVRQHIVDRLTLADTGPEFQPSLQGRMVTGYMPARLGVPRRPVPNVDTRALSPATGFYSTAEDLSRYGLAHCFGDQTLLSDASKREMQHAGWTIEGSDDAYGLGLSVQTIGERQLVGHGGGFPGQSTRTWIDPVEQLVVVVFSNTSASEGLAAPLATEAVRLIDFAQEKAKQVEQAPTWAVERYTGRFASVGGVIDVASFGNALVMLSPEADTPSKGTVDLEVVDGDTLRIARSSGYGSPGELVRFERGPDGQITQAISGGVSAYPEALFRERYQSQPRWLEPI